MANGRRIGRININDLVGSLNIPQTTGINRALEAIKDRGMASLGQGIDEWAEKGQFTSDRTSLSNFFNKIFKNEKVAKTVEDVATLASGAINPLLPLIKAIADKAVTDKEYKKTTGEMRTGYQVPDEFKGTFLENYMKRVGEQGAEQAKTSLEQNKKAQQLMDWLNIGTNVIPVAGDISKGFKGVSKNVPVKDVKDIVKNLAAKPDTLAKQIAGNVKDIGAGGLQWAGVPTEVLGALTKPLGKVGKFTLPSAGQLGMTQKKRLMDMLTSDYTEPQFTGMRAPRMRRPNMRGL